MKKFLLFLFAALFLFACKPQTEEGIDDQVILCSITNPVNGAQIFIGTPFEISVAGKVSHGEIENIQLLVNDESISGITEFPFTYTHSTEGLAEGTVTIKVIVTGESGVSAEDEVSVTAIIPKEEQTVQCSFDQPANGLSIVQGEKIIVKGKAEVNVGELKSFRLLIAGQEVKSFDSNTFEYEMNTADYNVGTCSLRLEATGDQDVNAYSEILIMITEGDVSDDSFTDPRDGNVYKLVKMGDQVWMAENLRYLPQVNKPSDGYDNETKGCNGEPYYFVYGYDGNDVNEAKALKIYKEAGVMYNWFAAIQGGIENAGDPAAVPSNVQGVCPDGWHIPSEAEWAVLYEWVYPQLPDVDAYVFDEELGDFAWTKTKNVSGALRSVSGWASYTDADFPDLANGPSDVFGFCVKPNGKCFPDWGGSDMQFTYGDTQANFWISSYDNEKESADYISFSYTSYDFGTGSFRDYAGMNVRCVRD